MRFQRGPMLAYAAVVLVGLLVIVQALGADVTSLHRVPRTLSGQSEFTVVPPAPTPDVSGVATIPGSAGASEETEEEPGPDRDAPDEQSPDQGSGEEAAEPPAEPGTPPAAEPSQQPSPGEDETEPPAQVPSTGPIPGIMAPLIWPFVAEEDAKPIDEAVPMFLQQMLAADAGVPVGELPAPEQDTSPAPKEPDGVVEQDERATKPEAAKVPESEKCEPAEETPLVGEGPGKSESESEESESEESESGAPDESEGEGRGEGESADECAAAPGCAEKPSPGKASPRGQDESVQTELPSDLPSDLSAGDGEAEQDETGERDESSESGESAEEKAGCVEETAP